MKTSKKFAAEDKFLSLVADLCSTEEESKIVDLFYKCMRLSHDEGVKEGISKAYTQLAHDIDCVPDMEDLYV